MRSSPGTKNGERPETEERELPAVQRTLHDFRDEINNHGQAERREPEVEEVAGEPVVDGGLHHAAHGMNDEQQLRSGINPREPEEGREQYHCDG